MGTSNLSSLHVTDSIGIVPRVIDRLYECAETSKHRCEIKASFLEIHNEDIHDLLNPSEIPISLREGPNGEIVAFGVSEQAASCKEDLIAYTSC